MPKNNKKKRAQKRQKRHVNVLAPTHGQLTPKSDGSFIDIHSAHFIGTDHFVYEVSDGKGGVISALVHVTAIQIAEATKNADNALDMSKCGTLRFKTPGNRYVYTGFEDFNGFERLSFVESQKRGSGTSPAISIRDFSISAFMLMALSGGANAGSASLPSGGTVAAGQASISQTSPTTLSITQSSPRAIVNWDGFSIGAGSAVSIDQPSSSSAILNRVTGDTTSTIAGNLSANGQVFLVNPNGIAITPTGTVNVGGFVGSSLSISDVNFMNGKLSFQGKGGLVSNQGQITASPTSFAALLGGAVSNTGTITVHQGKVGLGAGSAATLDPSGDGFMQVALPGAKARNTSNMVTLTGAQAREAVRKVVNMPPSVSTTTVSGTNGHVYFGSHSVARTSAKTKSINHEQAASGTVASSGKIDISGAANGGSVAFQGKHVTLNEAQIISTSSDAKGGSVTIEGESLVVKNSVIDASGATGGGNVKIGGDFHGAGSLYNAMTTTIEGTTIKADALNLDNAGQVAVWSNDKTIFDAASSISARAFGTTGNGGEAEVSGKMLLDYQGAADLRSAGGAFGTLLLDPYDVTISTGSDSSHNASFTATANSSVINTMTLQNALATANVTVSTGSSGAQTGNITVANALTWSANSTLTLSAASGIILNAGVTNSGTTSGLTLNSSGTGGISGSGALANSGTLNASIASGAASTYSGVISGTGALFFSGPGTLTLSGANTYTGATTVSAGTLQVSSSGKLGSGSYSGALTTASGATFLYSSSANQTFSNLAAGAGTVTLNGTGTATISGDQAFTGTLNLNQATNITGGSGGTYSSLGNAVAVSIGGYVTLNGAADNTFIGSAATTAVTINSGGTLYNPGVYTFHLGALTLNGGTLASAASLGSEASYWGTFNFDKQVNVTANSTISAVNLATTQTGGTVFNVSSGATLNVSGTINHVPSSSVYVGIVDSGLILQGGGTMVLSGANTYTGATTVSAGTLKANATSALSSSSNFTVASGATLDLNGKSNTIGSLAGAGTVTNSSATAATLTTGNTNTSTTFSGVLQNGSGTLSLTESGTGTLTLSGANTYTGTTSLSGGTLNLGSSGAVGSSGGIRFSGGTLQYSAANTTDYSSRFGSTSQLWNIDSNGQNVTFATALTGTTNSLTKSGAGTLTLSGANTYRGSTTISGGTLNLSGSLNIGSNTETVSVVSGATLSGTGVMTASTLSASGAGTVNLSGNNSIGTLTTSGTFNAFTLKDVSALSLGSVSSNGVISISDSNSITTTSGTNLTTQGQAVSLTSTGNAISLTGTTITTNNGGLTISAPSAGSSNAITFSDDTISLGTGTGSITGTATSGNGVSFSGANSLTASGAGSISISGTSTSHTGINFNSSSSVSASGTTSITGSSNTADGVYFAGSNTVSASSGALTLSGTTQTDHGLEFYGAVSLSAASGASILVNTTATDTSSGEAVWFGGSALTTQGTVTITAQNATANYTTFGFGGSTNSITDTSGNLSISATSTASGSYTIDFYSGSVSLTNSGSGTMSLSGISSSGYGVYFNNGTSLTTSGNISIAGSSNTGDGVYFAGSNTLTDISGNLTVSGTSTSSIGIDNESALTLTNSGAGTLTLNATTNGSTAGLYFNSGASLLTSGTVNVNATTSNGVGIAFSSSNSITDISGNLTLTTLAGGTYVPDALTLTNSGTGTLNFLNTGAFYVDTGATLSTSGTVNISGSGSYGDGIDLIGSNTITNTSGNLTLSGQSSTGTGFYTTGALTLTNSGSGTMSISGTSSSGSGVYFDTGQTLTTSGNMSISGSATSGYGVRFNDLNTITTTSGNLTVTGSSTGSGAWNGIFFYETNLTNSGSGMLSLVGTNASTVHSAIDWYHTSTLTSSGTGSISISGTSTSTSSNQYGIYFDNSAAISSSGTVSISGTSTLGSGLEFYSGSTVTNNSGNLTLTGTSTSGDGVYFAGSNTITSSSGALTLFGITGASGSQGINFNGNATLANSGSSLILSGSSTVSGGTGIYVSSGNTLTTSGAVTLTDGAASAASTALNVLGGILDSSGALTLGTVNGSGIISGVISGSGGLAKTGSGTLALSGTDTYTGSTAVNGGTLQISGSGSIGSGSYSGAISIASGATFEDSSSAAQTLSGVISGAGNLIKDTSNSSTLTLSGTNTYTGDTAVNAGTLQISGAGSLGSGSYGGAISIASGATFEDSSSAAQTLSGSISGAGNLIKDTSTSSTLTLSNANTYTGTTTINAGTLALSNTTNSSAFTVASGATLQVGSNGSDYNFNTANSSITGAGTLQKIGSNNVTFGSGSTTFAWQMNAGGLIDVQAGTLTGSTNYNDIWTSNLSSLNVASGAQFNGVEGNIIVDKLTGTGAVESGWSSGYIGITIGAANGSSTFNGVVQNKPGYTANIIKAGTGTITLSNSNTYTGTTTINAGTLALSNTTSSSAFTVASGATLQVGNNGSDYFFNTATNSSITGAGTLQKIGSNNVTFGSGTKTFDWQMSAGGLIDVEAGMLTGGTNYHDIWTSNLSSLNVASGAQFNGVEANVIVDKLTGTGTVETGYSSGYVGMTIGAANSSSTFNGVIQDHPGYTANIIKAGTGTITLTGANTYNGSTTVNAGTLQIGGSGTLGSGNYAGAISIASGATFEDSSSAAQTLSGVISGAGALTKDASSISTLTLSNANTYTGATTVNAGTLQIGGSGTLGSGNYGGALTVASGATFNYASSASSQIFSNLAAGTGTINLTGTGQVNISGDQGFTGTLNVGEYVSMYSGSNLMYAGLGHAAAINITNGTIDLSGETNDNSFIGYYNPTVITVNAGGLITQAGNLTFHLGSLNLNGGTLATSGGISGDGALYGSYNLDSGVTVTANSIISAQNVALTQTGGVNFNIAPGITIAGSGTFNHTNIGSDTGLIVNGGGTMVLSGANTYTGSTTVNAGTLLISGSGQLGSGSYSGALTTASGANFLYSSSANQTFSNLAAGAGTVTLNGTGTATISGDQAFTGTLNLNQATNITGGTGSSYSNLGNAVAVNIGGYVALDGVNYNSFIGSQPVTPVTINSGGTLYNSGFSTFHLAALTLNGGTLASAASLGTGASYWGTFNFDKQVNVTANSTISAANTTTTQNGGTVFNVSPSTTLNVSGTINHVPAANDYVGVFDKGLILQGGGTMVLSGANTFTSNTTINAGTLQISGAGQLGSGSYSGALTTASGANFLYSSSANQTFSNLAAGAGTVTLNGTGTATISGNQAFSGTLNLNQATNITGDANTGYSSLSNAVAVNIGGYVTLNASYSNNFIGSAPTTPVTINSGGTLYHPGVYTFHLGALTLNGGTLASGASLGSEASYWGTFNFDKQVNVTANSTVSAINLAITQSGGTVFNVSPGVILNVNGTINHVPAANVYVGADGGLILQGGGTMVLSGANTYTGDTAVNAGILQISGSGSVGSGSYGGAISIASGATFQDSSSAAQTLSGVISGAGNLTKDTSTSSTLTLSGSNTYTGTTNVNAGTVNLSGSLNVGTGTATAVVALGATLSGSGVITAATFADSGAGTVNLTGNNAVGAISTSGTLGAFAFNNNQSIALGSINSTGTIAVTTTAGSNANLTLSNGATLTSAASGTAITLAADGGFVNNSGSSALSAASGRWLVFSSNPGADTFGGLDSAQTALWGTTYASSGGVISQTGNRYVFANQPTLTFTSTNDTKTYGVNATSAVAADYMINGYGSGVSGAFSGDNAASVFSGAPSVTSTGAAAGASVAGGPYTITLAQGSLAALNGYAFAYASSGALTVTPASLTVTANAQSKIYGAVDPSLTYGYAGLVNGDMATVFSGALSRAAGESVATYAIGQGSLTAGGNYTIAYTGANLGITPASLTVTANAQSKTYGAADPSLTYGYAGLVNGDMATVFSGSLTRAAGESVGAYAIGQGSLTAGGNYTIAYTGANLGITPAALTVTATAQSKVYGAVDPSLTYGYAGLVNGDMATVFSGSLTRALGESVGAYAIGQGSLTAGGNYTIAYTGANLGITPAALTVTATAQSKVYGAVDPTLTYGYAGLVNGDMATVFSGSLTRALGESVGAYAIGQGSLTAGGNYTIAYTGANLGITPAALTVTATAQSKVYGAVDPSLTYGYAGLVNGDMATVFSGSLTRALGESVGAYAIGQGSLTAGGNYTIAYTGANLGITPAALTVTATAQSKVYGAVDPTLTYGYAGLVNGDMATVFSGSLSRAAGESVGAYAIGQGSLTAGSNYTLSYNAANLAITPASLTVTATAQSKIYGAVDPSLTYGYAGLVNGDMATVFSGSLSRTAGESVGAYAIGQGSLTAGVNYTIAYTGANLGITPASLTVTTDVMLKNYDLSLTCKPGRRHLCQWSKHIDNEVELFIPNPVSNSFLMIRPPIE